MAEIVLRGPCGWLSGPCEAPDGATAAAALAACLQARGYRAKVIDRLGAPVRLKVTNPAAVALSETIIVHAGAFWWPWRDQIGPAADAPRAAEIIARVLAASDDPTRTVDGHGR